MKEESETVFVMTDDSGEIIAITKNPEKIIECYDLFLSYQVLKAPLNEELNEEEFNLTKKDVSDAVGIMAKGVFNSLEFRTRLFKSVTIKLVPLK